MPQYFLDPNADAKADWTETPVGTAFSALDDAVRAPSVPNLTDFISSSTNGQLCFLDLTTVTLGGGEDIVSFRVWLYVSTPAAATIDVDVQDGSNHFIGLNIPSNTSGWVSAKFVGPITQTQLSALRINLTANIVAGAVTVYAAYVEVNTRTDMATVANNRIMAARNANTGLSAAAGFFGGDIWAPVDLGAGRSLILMGDCEIATAAGQQHTSGTNQNSPGAARAQFQRGPVLIMDNANIELANYTVFSGSSGVGYSYFAERTIGGFQAKRWPLNGIVRSGRLFVVGYTDVPSQGGNIQGKWMAYSDNWSVNPANPSLWTWTYVDFNPTEVGIGDMGIVEDSGFMYLFSAHGFNNQIQSIYRLTTANFQAANWKGGEWWTGGNWVSDRQVVSRTRPPTSRVKRASRGNMFAFPLIAGAGGNQIAGATVVKRADNGKWQVVSIFSSPLVGATPFKMQYSITPGTSLARFPAVTDKWTIPEGESFVYSARYCPWLTWTGKGVNDQVWSYTPNSGSEYDTGAFPRWVKALAVT